MMRKALGLVVLAGVALAFGPAGRAEDKGTVVSLDGLKSKTPASWKEEAPSNKMRFAQFRLPKVKGDVEDAELVIFKGLGGAPKANVERWKGQFRAPAGKKIDEVSKVSEMKIAGNDAVLLDVTGIYLYNPAPFNPRSKTVARPGYRMLAIHFEGPETIYHIKLTGPAKTIEHHKAGFDAWIKGLKK